MKLSDLMRNCLEIVKHESQMILIFKLLHRIYKELNKSSMAQIQRDLEKRPKRYSSSSPLKPYLQINEKHRSLIIKKLRANKQQHFQIPLVLQ